MLQSYKNFVKVANLKNILKIFQYAIDFSKNTLNFVGKLNQVTFKTTTMKTWKIQLEIEVSDIWIQDGFDASERLEQIEEMITELLPHAIPDVEIKVKAKVTSAPPPELLAKIMGYSGEY